MERALQIVYLVLRAGTVKLDQPPSLVFVIEDMCAREHKLWQLPLELSISSTTRLQNQDLALKVITVQLVPHTPFLAKQVLSRTLPVNTSAMHVLRPVIAAQSA